MSDLYEAARKLTPDERRTMTWAATVMRDKNPDHPRMAEVWNALAVVLDDAAREERRTIDAMETDVNPVRVIGVQSPGDPKPRL